MDESQPQNNVPAFSSLTEIMERFQAVPYEQFQKELQSWFEASLAQKDQFSKIKGLGTHFDLSKLTDLIGNIYHQAEVSQLLSNTKIKTDEQGK